MRIGSLFSGYGGLDLAVQSVLGGKIAWYSEIEPAACKVLAAHHPGVPNLGDITKVNWADVEPVDILTGGYPCQPFSHAGKRKGTDDERHLWPYVRDAIAAIRPMVAVFENVDGHRSLGLADVLGDLAELGMSVRWGVVRAADAGAPHGRKRVFIVAHPEGGRWGTRQGSTAAQARPVISGASDDGWDVGDTDRLAGETGSARLRGPGKIYEPGAVKRVERPDSDAPADAAEQGLQGRSVPTPSIDGTGSSRIAPVFGAELAADADGSSGKARRDTGPDSQRIRIEPLGFAAPSADADGHGYGGGQDSRGVGILEAGDEGQARERQWPRSESGTGVAWGKYEPAIRRWEHLTRPAPEPTVPGKNGRPRLSPDFVEWMMGLPAGHVTGHDLSAAQQLKMLGNGVVPQQAALALRMLGVGA